MNIKEKEQILDPIFKELNSRWYNICVHNLEISNEQGIKSLKEMSSELYSLNKGLNRNIIISFLKQILGINKIDIKNIENVIIGLIMNSFLILENLEEKKDRQKFITKIIKKQKDIMINKSHDYAISSDVLSNFKMSEILFNIPNYVGILIRISDKISRIENVLSKGESKVKDESLQDTLIDLANYSLLFYLCVIDKYDKDYRADFSDKTKV